MHFSRRDARAALAGLALSALGSASVALTIQAAQENAAGIAELRVQPGVAIGFDQLEPEDQIRSAALLTDFGQATGSRWSTLDYAVGSLTPRLAYGSGLDMGTPVQDAETAELLARELVETHPELFGTENSRLQVWKSVEADGKWAIHFREVVNGMKILDSKVTMIFTESGRLASFGASTFPMIESAESPSLSKDAVVSAAHSHLVGQSAIAADLSQVTSNVNGPYIIPTIAGEGTPAPGTAGIEGRVVYRATMSTKNPPVCWDVDVDATSGEVLQRLNRIFHVDFTGSVSADVEDPDFCDVSGVQGLADIEVRIDGVGSAVTAADGSFTIPNAGSDPADFEVTLYGPYAQVFNDDGPEGLMSGTATPGVPLDVLWDSDDARFDERDVFFHTNATRQMLIDINPTWVDMDFRMPCNVNIDSQCNAFYSFADSSTNYYRADEPDGCGNTGRMGDVIAHEYGHGITHQMYDEDQPGILHEGNSDIAAVMLFGRSQIGRGFFNLTDCGTPLRDSDNDLMWPIDSNGNSYNDGQIMAGFYWNSILNLAALYGDETALEIMRNNWHNGRLLTLPRTITEQVLSAFIADDDNGNLDDGTPNFDELCAGATIKGFDCPETFDDVVLRHSPLLYASTDPGGHRIVAEIYSLLGDLNAAETAVHWRVSGGGAFNSVPFTPFDGNNQEAFIPSQPVLTKVDYFVVGTDEFGNTLQLPQSGYYSFDVVTAFHSGEQGAEGWTVGDPSDTATQGIWELIDPAEEFVAGRFSQPGDDASLDPGTMAWITEQEGGSPAQHDVDTGTTTLFSPVFDVSGSAWVHVQFMRWFQSLVGAAGQMDFYVTHDAGDSWDNLFHLEGTQPTDSWQLFGSLVSEPGAGFGDIQFKLVVTGAANPSIDEGGLDEFVLIASDTGSPSSVEENGVITDVSLRLRSPNPSTGIATLEYALPEAGTAQLSIYGVDGRRVRSLLRGQVEAGIHQVNWDGRDETGRMVGSGVYFARIHTQDGSDVRRVVIGR